MNRKEAADFLGVSEKTVSRHVNSGKIAAQRVAGSLDISVDELELFKSQMSVPTPVVSVTVTEDETEDKTGQTAMSQVQAGQSLARSSSPNSPGSGGGFVLVLENAEAVRELGQVLAGHGTGQDKSVPLADKKTLSVAEAAQLSGVSESVLREGVRDGRLRAVKIGRGRRVLQADLDAFVNGLFDSA